MAEHSGFHHLRPALMAAMLLMAGCAAPATVSDGSSPIQQDRTSETAHRPDSGDRHIKSILSRLSRMEKGEQEVVAQTVNALADALEKNRQG